MRSTSPRPRSQAAIKKIDCAQNPGANSFLVSFDEHILQWQPFFTTVASVSATLVGLLFVSLSLNREKIAGESNRVLLRLARRSFSDFLFVVLIALFFLIPGEGRRYLAMELLALSAIRLRWLLAQIISSARGGQKPAAMDLVREYLLPVLTVLGLVVAGIGIFQENILAVYYFIVPVIATLLLRASWNAWLLLIMESN
jgi:hypothetical protein